MTLLFFPVAIAIFGFGSWLIYREFREGQTKLRHAQAAERPPRPLPAPSSSLPLVGTTPAARLSPAGQALGWNIAIIVIGALIGMIGLGAWLVADPTNSALRQTVAALWLIAGLLGLVIAAIGTLGATLVHVMKIDRYAVRIPAA